MWKEWLRDCGICYGAIFAIIGLLVLFSLPIFHYIFGILIIGFIIFVCIQFVRIIKAIE